METVESLRHRLQAAKATERTTAAKLRQATDRKRKREQEEANFAKGTPRPQAMKYLMIFLAVAAGDGGDGGSLAHTHKASHPMADMDAGENGITLRS